MKMSFMSAFGIEEQAAEDERRFLYRALDEALSQDDGIHLRPQKAIKRFLRPADDRLVLVEGCVEDHRHAGSAKGRDELPVSRVCLPVDGLQAARAVDMRDCGDERSLLLADLINLHHERHVAVLLEPLGDMLSAESMARKGESSRAA